MTMQLNVLNNLHTFSDQAVGTILGALTGGGTPASAAWPASNDALFIPFDINKPIIIKRLFTINGGTASGNVDVGIYTEDGSLLTSIGSTAQSGTNAPQFFNITDIMLSPGRYYLAVAMNNTTGTMFRANLTTIRNSQLGVAKMATAFPLPATATFATTTSGFLPFIGAEIKAMI